MDTVVFTQLMQDKMIFASNDWKKKKKYSYKNYHIMALLSSDPQNLVTCFFLWLNFEQNFTEIWETVIKITC